MSSRKFSISNFQFSIQNGFTLIELLVVITILGILAGMSLVSYSGTQARSRDSRRKTDLDAIRKTLELVKADSTGQYYYPSCFSYIAGACNLTTGSSTTPDLTVGTTPYIKTLPTDPKTSVGYKYIPTPANCGASLCTDYTLIACLENGTDSQGVADAVNCPTAPSKAYRITPN